MTLTDVIRTSTRLLPTTRATYIGAIERFESFAAGRPFTGALVEAWRDDRLASGVSATTVYRDLAAIRFVSRRAAALGLAHVDFAAAAEFPTRAPWTPRQALTVDEFRRLEDVCRRAGTPVGMRDAAMIAIAGRACGARRGELAGLTVGAYRRPMLRLSRKGGWTQSVTVDGYTADVLDRWIAWRGGRAGDPLFVQLRRTVEDKWVTGGGLSASGVAHIIVSRAREAGIRRRIGPHLLRHGFVSMALAAGVPAHRVMVAAGHRSLTTTSRYVSEVVHDGTPVGDAIAGVLGASWGAR